MAADIYTKGFTNAEKWLEVAQNICVVHPKALKANIARAQADWKDEIATRRVIMGALKAVAPTAAA